MSEIVSIKERVINSQTTGEPEDRNWMEKIFFKEPDELNYPKSAKSEDNDSESAEQIGDGVREAMRAAMLGGVGIHSNVDDNQKGLREVEKNGD